ncbi:MAG: hypothetical protein [Bacteriophage sp.]|nr:MAG: hypothetical protein [Bacteriophage sp.]
MKDLLITLKDYLLNKYDVFTKGEAPVTKLQGSEVIIPVGTSDPTQGISPNDHSGTAFYVRYTGETTYTPIQRGARVQYYSAVSVCKLVAYSHGNESEDILTTLVNSITMCGHVVTRSNTESTSVFRTETGTDLLNNNLQLVSVDFEVTQIVSGTICTLNPCDC